MKQIIDNFLEYKDIHEFLMGSLDMDLNDARPYLNRISELKQDPYVKHYALENGYSMDQWAEGRKKRDLGGTWEFQGTYH